jgi:hypothetical protein
VSVQIIDELLAFDDRPELLEFRFSFGDTWMLPFLRWGLYSAATDPAWGWQTAHANPALGVRDRAGYLLRSLWANPLRVDRTYELVMFASSAGAVMPQAGRWFDRINDYFALEYDDRTLVIDAAYRGRYAHPRVPKHVRCGDGFSLLAAARSRLARPSAGDEATVGRLQAFLERHFPVRLDDRYYARLRAGLLGLGRRLPFLHDLYNRFFERVRPRILFVEDGHYGSMGHVLRWARDAGVVTAELQHGLVSPSHLAYNYGPALCRSPELARYVPQHFLTYGEYWVDQLRTPARSEVIGWPHFSRRVVEHRQRARPDARNILVISQGTVTHQLVALTRELAPLVPGQEIVYRLHPGEVPFRDRYAPLAAHPNVRVDTSGDIYDCFAAASAVIGHSSTAVVEAAALGLPTFILEDSVSRLFIPPGLGTRFERAGELAKALASPQPPAVTAEQFAAPDWRARYRAFVERVAARAA